MTLFGMPTLTASVIVFAVVLDLVVMVYVGLRFEGVTDVPEQAVEVDRPASARSTTD
jgi:hypothetical protein